MAFENRSARRLKASRAPLKRTRAAVVGAWIFAGALAGTGACSFVVENEVNQCAADADCARFGAGAVCREGLCAPPDNTGDQCFEGVPTTNDELLNKCTDAQCIPFDNCARLGLCDGAELPALVDPVAP